MDGQRFKSLPSQFEENWVKSRFRVELNSTGSDQVVLGLVTHGDLLQVSVDRGALVGIQQA